MAKAEAAPASDGCWEAGEPELVARARLDPRAFGPLYDRYAERVYRYCHRRLGGREAAEDATAQTFARALAGLPGFRGGSFAAWLFAIAHNVCANARRDARADRPLESAGEVADVAPSPEELAVAADDGRALRALLAGLPADQRRVVELRLAGLTGAEIAEVLGRSLASVKMLQVRALARLRAAHAAASGGGDRERA
jgi:RNA polymerase sigma-70 factor, ECF subfamily